MRLSPYIPPWHTYYFVLANLWNGDLALLWQNFSGTEFPNQIFSDS